MVHVEIVILVLVYIDFEMGDFVLYATSQN